MENKKITSILTELFDSFALTDKEGFTVESFGSQDFLLLDFVEAMVLLLEKSNFSEQDYILSDKDNKQYCLLSINNKFFFIGVLKNSTTFSKMLYFKEDLIKSISLLIQL